MSIPRLTAHIYTDKSHALLDTFLVAADAVIIPTKISAADISGAVKLLQRLAALDRLGTPYAEPLGAALMAVPSSAKRLLEHAERELEVITRHIPLFKTRLHYRPAPISEAERRHTTLRQLQASLPTAGERLAALRGGKASSGEHLTAESIAKTVDEISNLYDEVVQRHADQVAA